MSKTRIAVLLVFLLGLIYLLWPGPSSIEDIPELPDSLKSDEPGDTTQNKNIAAYFSQQRRAEITSFYKNKFRYLNIFGLKIPPLVFNHPVENAQTLVRDQVRSTFLEEYSYPFRDSLYVNGYDKKIWNDLKFIESDSLNTTLIINEQSFNTKTTIRYYPSLLFWRVVLYICFWVSLILLSKFTYRAWKKY